MTEPPREDVMLDYAREKVEQDKHRESRGSARSRAVPLTFFREPRTILAFGDFCLS